MSIKVLHGTLINKNKVPNKSHVFKCKSISLKKVIVKLKIMIRRVCSIIYIKVQIMYKNMNEYDYNEEMPVDTRSEKIMRARLAFSDNYEEMQENVGDGSSLMTKITLLLLIFSAVLVLCFGDLTIGNYSNKSIRQAMSKEGTVWHDMVEITGNIISDVMEELNEKTSFK